MNAAETAGTLTVGTEITSEAELHEVLGGYALLNAASLKEAVEHTRNFLEHTAQETCEGTWEGTWETYQLYELAAEEGQ